MKKNSFELLEKTINSISVELLEQGHLFADREWKHFNVSSSFNRLYFILDGSAYIENGMHRVYLEPGKMYLVPINSTYNYICENALEKFFVHFRVEIFFGRDFFEQQKSCISLPFDKHTVMRLLDKLNTGKLDGVFLFKAFMYEVLFAFMQETEYNLKPQIEVEYKYQELYRFIKNNCSAKLTPRMIADNLRIPLENLSKTYKKDTGYSLKSYIDSIVIQSAKDKLLFSDMSVKEIALHLDFTDEFYFSRFFKKYSGISPKGYKNKNKIGI